MTVAGSSQGSLVNPGEGLGAELALLAGAKALLLKQYNQVYELVFAAA